jgi:hypothetical protein
MYANLLRRSDDIESQLRLGKDPALYHQGDYRHLIETHEKHCLLRRNHPTEVPPVAPLIMPRLAHSHTMRVACDDLLEHGGEAPGPNGLRLRDLDDPAIWSLCRTLARGVRDGTYQMGPERRVSIPKGPGRGSRVLTIQNIEDRIVGRATLRILQPLIDPDFSPFSFGFRPARGTVNALASALALARQQRTWIWVCADVANAFDAIPHARLLNVCGKPFPDEVVSFIDRISGMKRKRGIRQGSPVSPFFCNLFFDLFLDLPWHRKHQDPPRPLIRYADNLLVMCQTLEEAVGIHNALGSMARSAGIPLKPCADHGINDIQAGCSVTWLGFLLRREETNLAIRVGEQAWNDLTEGLSEAHLHSASPLRATQVVSGWLQEIGPCFAFEDREAVMQRIREIAGSLAFDEIPGPGRLIEIWSAAHARWKRLYDHEVELLPHRLHLISRVSPRARVPSRQVTTRPKTKPGRARKHRKTDVA